MFYDLDLFYPFFKRDIDVDVMEDTEKIVIEADVPGYTEKDIEIKVEDNTLVLNGKMEKTQNKAVKLLKMERIKKTSFYRTFYLPEYTNAEKIQAEFKNGILTITIPKETKKTKSIPIKIQT